MLLTPIKKITLPDGRVQLPGDAISEADALERTLYAVIDVKLRTNGIYVGTVQAVEDVSLAEHLLVLAEILAKYPNARIDTSYAGDGNYSNCIYAKVVETIEEAEKYWLNEQERVNQQRKQDYESYLKLKEKYG